jgi:hypothetical protein
LRYIFVCGQNSMKPSILVINIMHAEAHSESLINIGATGNEHFVTQLMQKLVQ